MSKRILLRAPRDPFTPVGAREILARNLIANNVGNLVFAQASQRILSRSDHTIHVGGSVPRSRDVWLSRIQGYQHYVLPLANAFRPAFAPRLSTISTAIRKMRIPVTVLGVGAQAPLDGKEQAATEAIAPVVREFIAAVLDHSPSIGVRGEYTRDYVKSLGFGDEYIRVIGCPSLFWDGPNLKKVKPAGTLQRDSKIAVTVSPYVKKMGRILVRTLKNYPRATYFAQDIQTLALLLGEDFHFPVAGPHAPTRRDHLAFSADRTVFCLDPRTWFELLADVDFTFGTRIHGTIASLLAGTEAVLLAHDSRTLELAEYFQLPYRLITEVDPKAPLQDLVDGAQWDAYVSGHESRWHTFENFLHEHGLNHAFADGGAAADFDRQLAAAHFPPPVRTCAAQQTADSR